MSGSDFMLGDRVRHLITQELLVVWDTELTTRGNLLARNHAGKTKRVAPKNLVHARYDSGWDPTEPCLHPARYVSGGDYCTLCRQSIERSEKER